MNILLYKNITMLLRERHNELKLKPGKNFSFAAATHWLPIVGTEFYQASHHYSIVFMKGNDGGKDTFSPIILTGLEMGCNGYVSKGGEWKENTYIPDFVRRYPFVLVSEEHKAPKLTVCFDSAFSGFNNREGLALFKDDGTNSDFLDETIRFMEEFNMATKATYEFVALLQEMNLLEKRNAEICHPSGAVFNIVDFFQISEQKLANLHGEQLAKFHEKGFLGWIFAHLMSFRNLPGLADIQLSNRVLSDKMLKNKTPLTKEAEEELNILRDFKMPPKEMLN